MNVTRSNAFQYQSDSDMQSHKSLYTTANHDSFIQAVTSLIDTLEMLVSSSTVFVTVQTEENKFLNIYSSSIDSSFESMFEALSLADSPQAMCSRSKINVFIEDFSTCHQWPELCQVILSASFKSAWFQPIYVQNNIDVIGVISFFNEVAGPPSSPDLQISEKMTGCFSALFQHQQACIKQALVNEAMAVNTAVLHKQRRLYEAVLANNPDPVYTFDLAGRFTYVNDALLAIWGISWDEAIGKTCHELNYEKWHADLHMHEIQTVIATKKPIRNDIPYHGAQGLRVYDYIFVPVFDADGNVEAVAGSTRDITERYQAEKVTRESEARRRIALEASHSFGVWDWDLKRNVFTADQRLGEIFNLTVEEATNGVPIERPLEYIHPEDLPAIEKAIEEAISNGMLYDQQYRILQKDGSIRWGSFRGRVIYDDNGDPESFPGVGVDITLEQNAINALHDANKRKDEFLATLAHELRNPLAPIRNALEILQSGDYSKEKKQESYLLVERQVTQMVRLVDDLMDVSRITRGKIRIARTPLSICDAIHDAIETVQPLIDECNHKLVVSYPETDAWVEGDLVRLAQIFSNIVNNAAKYTPPGGFIDIQVLTSNDEVMIKISDSGVGIPQDKLQDVFDMFTQIEGVLERSQGGLGIGLTLVKRLVELHDGTVAVSSSDKGTCFSVAFPRIAPVTLNPGETPIKVSSAVTSTNISVLIVDDNQDAAITMGWILEAKGCDVVVVEDGFAALDAVKRTTPDLVLLDIGMPGMNGYDLCIALNKIPALKNAIFVAQTGWGQPAHIQRSKASGFHHHLVKPLDLDDLMPIVNSVKANKYQH